MMFAVVVQELIGSRFRLGRRKILRTGSAGFVCALLQAAVSTLLPLAGCGVSSPCGPLPSVAARTASIVLTFDDGPLAADVRHTADADPGALLAPLEGILGTLDRRGIQAVFYISGPRPEGDARVLLPVYGAGLRMIAERGHRIGYHGYAHVADIWANPLLPPWLNVLMMDADVDALVAYVDEALATAELRPSHVMSPLFRQPYGGYGLTTFSAQVLAASRGWIYHGFHIDSVDWTDNLTADAPIVANLATAQWADDPQAHAGYVVARLQAGAQRFGAGSMFDALFHVNHFTAERLDGWIDALSEGSSAATGASPRFEVPTCYLSQADGAVDLSVVGEALITAPQ